MLNTARNFLIKLDHQLQMHFKLLQKTNSKINRSSKKKEIYKEKKSQYKCGKKYIFPEKKQNIINDLRLIQQYNN